MDKRLDHISKKCTKIFIDADGVLLASNDAMCTLLNEIYKKNHKGKEVTDWNYTDLYPTNSIEVEKLFESEEFFKVVKFTHGAKRFLTRYRGKIVIVTKGTITNFIRKRYWFNKNGFRDIPIIAFPLNISKNIINMHGGLFIDDCTVNLRESNATYKFMFSEYNDNVKRDWCKDWRGNKIYKW